MAGLRPLIAIKAGKCTQAGNRITPSPEPGLLYLYNNPDDDLLHFCWRHRSSQAPEEDLIIIPGDATFEKYSACTTGRVFLLKFSSSSRRHFFWLQVKAESENPGHWSVRDNRWGDAINRLLQGVDDDDEEMGDPDAELGSEDIEEEGSASRRGGEDGGRADSPSPFTSIATEPQNQTDFLKSLISSINVGGPSGSGPSGSGPSRYGQQTPSLSLHDLLATSTTVPILSSLSGSALDNVIANLPPALVPKNATESQKKDIIRRVLQSPQFMQSNVSLSVALRDGALRGVADSLGVPLRPGEEAAGDQVEVFLRGVKRGVEEEEEGAEKEGGMDID